SRAALDPDLQNGALERRGQRVPAEPGGTRRPLPPRGLACPRGGLSGCGDSSVRGAGGGGPDHPDVEALARDLDGVCVLDLVLAVTGRRGGGRRRRKCERLQPRPILDQVTTGL